MHRIVKTGKEWFNKMLTAFVFYMFASVLVLSAIMVIAARNPVHSVLFLILAFFNAAGLFILLGAEFIAMLLVIVYVGAVAVLFLFVVMMLDISFHDLRKGALQFVPVGLLLGGVLLIELVTLYAGWQSAPSGLLPSMETPTPDQVSNTKALGAVLYTQYMLPFQVSGLILLVSMIGAIVLTLRTRPDLRRQSVGKQVSRQVSDALSIQAVETGSGVKDV